MVISTRTEHLQLGFQEEVYEGHLQIQSTHHLKPQWSLEDQLTGLPTHETRKLYAPSTVPKEQERKMRDLMRILTRQLNQLRMQSHKQV